MGNVEGRGVGNSVGSFVGYLVGVPCVGNGVSRGPVGLLLGKLVTDVGFELRVSVDGNEFGIKEGQ